MSVVFFNEIGRVDLVVGQYHLLDLQLLFGRVAHGFVPHELVVVGEGQPHFLQLGQQLPVDHRGDHRHAGAYDTVEDVEVRFGLRERRSVVDGHRLVENGLRDVGLRPCDTLVEDLKGISALRFEEFDLGTFGEKAECRGAHLPQRRHDRGLVAVVRGGRRRPPHGNTEQFAERVPESRHVFDGYGFGRHFEQESQRFVSIYVDEEPVQTRVVAVVDTHRQVVVDVFQHQPVLRHDVLARNKVYTVDRPASAHFDDISQLHE